MLDTEIFLPPLNSTFVDAESIECARIIHDLVFQRYGSRRKLHRSKRLKALREMFYPDIVDESYPKADTFIDFRNMTGINNDDQLTTVDIIRKVNGKDTEHELNGPETFCIDKDEDPEYFLNDSMQICRRRLDLTYTQSIGTEDISDLLSDRSTHFSYAKSPCKAVSDDNNNTVVEESADMDEKETKDLHECIEAQELAIQEFEKVLVFGRRQRGFAGSIPHIQAEKGLLVANIRKQVFIGSLNNEFRPSLTQTTNRTGKITISNIKCDTNLVLGSSHGIPPCYYLCIMQHKATVLCTDILAPDMHGVVEFLGKYVFDNITNQFEIKLLLFKLQLKPDSEQAGWRKSLGKRQIELPKLHLVGYQEIFLSNINKTAFPYENEILYANLNVCINMPNKKEGTLTIQKIVRKTKLDTKLVSHKRWCVLDGTDLKVYRCREDVGCSEPVEVISLVYCKGCKPYFLTPRTIVLDFVHAYFGRKLYLLFDDKDAFRDWMKQINMAIATARSFGL